MRNNIEKRPVTFHIDGSSRSANYHGDPETLQRFDELTYNIGSNRSRVIGMFINECVAANKILLPSHINENYRVEAIKAEEKLQKTEKEEMTFMPFNGTISTI